MGSLWTSNVPLDNRDLKFSPPHKNITRNCENRMESCDSFMAVSPYWEYGLECISSMNAPQLK